jgi:adenylate cyclase
VSTRKLLIHHPDGSTQIFEITQPIVRIGRAEGNDVVLGGNRISRMHAQIACDGDSPAVVSDLKSANGVVLNGKLLRDPAPLYSDDVLQIGPYKLIYTDPSPGAERTKTDTSPSPFRIQAGSVELNELQQQQPRLLPIGDASIELRSLELLHEVGVTLARTVSVADVIGTAVALLFKIEGVHRATLMLWDDEKQEVKGADVRARDGIDITGPGFDPRKLVLSNTILRRVRQENRPLHIQDATSDAALSGAMSIMHAGIRAAFCSPLTFQGRMMGVLYADNLAEPNAFSAADFRLFTTIAAQTGLALASAISRGELLRREVEQAAMRLYMPSQVADLILASEGGVELGGVLQTVTVLFADIRGFTRISERMDAREVVLLLNEFFTEMTKVIFDAGGTLDKYIGDCVMALFGAPVPSEEDAEHALSAAIQMQQAVARLNARRSERGQPDIQMGIGLHCGRAVVGNVGSTQRMQYTAIGDTVNVAARLMNQAAGGTIVVSETFTKAVKHSDAFEHLGEVQLKGRDQKVSVYSVIWK